MVTKKIATLSKIGVQALLISALAITTGCIHKTATPAPIPSPGTILTTAPFNTITVKTPVSLTITKDWHAAVKADRGNPNNIKISIVKNNLILEASQKSDGGYPGLSITVPALTKLTLQSCATIDAANLGVFDLSVTGNQRCDTNIKGQLFVANTVISQSSDSKIAIDWLKTNNITIKNSGTSLLLLAGTAKKAQIELSGSATLDAKYLRTKYLTIKTSDRAKASILPLRSLKANSFDSSNIYYYHLPQTKSLTSSQKSNILRMPEL